jgi:7-keto-8-aminopelargonate synthetase-like enzyme
MNRFNVELSDLYLSARQLYENGCIFQYIENKKYNGRKVTISNKKLLHFASCSYLGLETHPRLIEGAIEATRRYGTQTPSSRAVLSSALYKEAENNLKNIFPGFLIITQTVTLGHFSVLPLVVKENDAIILDAYVHNSIRMASQYCRANGISVFPSRHNNMDHVKYLIYRLKKEGYRNIWYCADGIYSIHGDLLDVKGLNELLDHEDNFYAYVDDAHGTGWCGKNGCGYVIGHYGLHPKMIVIVSFAKSFAACGGGLIVPDEELAELIRMTGQTMIFSGPLQPSTLGALIASAKLHLSDEIDGYQNELTGLISHFRKRSMELKLPIVTKDTTPIQLLRIGDMENTNTALKKLRERGCLATTAAYPAIAHGDEGIRITLTRHLKKSDIDYFLESINDILKSDLNFIISDHTI